MNLLSLLSTADMFTNQFYVLFSLPLLNKCVVN